MVETIIPRESPTEVSPKERLAMHFMSLLLANMEYSYPALKGSPGVARSANRAEVEARIDLAIYAAERLIEKLK